MKRREFLFKVGAGGLLLPVASRATIPCPPPTVSAAGQSATTQCSAVTAQSDWQTRITGPGVVWYNGFESQSEVNQFLWAGSYGGGNDPLAKSSDAGMILWNATGGPGGTFPYIEIDRPAARESNINWWRPFSALHAPGNGRTTDDPGAGQPLRTWTPTDRSSTTNQWAQDFYGPSTYPGQTFYLQMRVMSDPRRFSAPYQAVSLVGKKFYLTTTTQTLTAQEIVTYQGTQYHRVYASGSPPLEDVQSGTNYPGEQIGSQLANYPAGVYCDVGTQPQTCWAFGTNQWDTLLYEITPGSTSGINVSVVSAIKIYAAKAGATSYTKIWDESFKHAWDQTGQYGWNALTFNTYCNNLTFPGPFWQRYAQVIFSLQMIPCPLV